MHQIKGSSGANMITPAQRAARFGQLDWRFDDLSGQKFGRLHVLGRDGKDCSGHIRFHHCRCSCGRAVVIVGTSLRMGRTISCGCFMNQRRAARGRAFRLTARPFAKAIRIHDALERAIGVERLNKIFEISSRNSHKLPASAITTNRRGSKKQR